MTSQGSERFEFAPGWLFKPPYSSLRERVISPKCVHTARDDITHVSGFRALSPFLLASGLFNLRLIRRELLRRKNVVGANDRRFNGRRRDDGAGRLGGVTNVYGHQRLITPPVVNRMIITTFVL